ncbi:acyl-CoA/acyl-ACP dehydrogenase [Rhodococcus sp. 14C212]|uniref:acyl-CoA dehydrogenase family protein n=1 Tax=Rhodococcus sp. 14C212 TaxID=2711209 RepID=UPI0013E9FBF4|nr:acyl-CoA dehydrogenase family protein [Rhodococcus sp. 14C212]NGP07395.1 acyl-CoA/acyl-ACP dehydrogenase [Rhodococcus sp. 14C212]
MDFELDPEQEEFRKSVRDWVDNHATKAEARMWERDEENFPTELWSRMAAAGFHGIGIPEEYGGQGGDSVTQLILARELARTLGGLTWAWGVTSFAGAHALLSAGTAEQRERLLPPISRGEDRWAIGFTEPGGGTDLVGGLRMQARRVDGGWQLSGQKTYCTGAEWARYILVLARTSTGDRPRDGLTMFIVPTDSQGLSFQHIPKVGFRGLRSSEVFFDDVIIPDNMVLGEVGHAFRALLGSLNNERIVLAGLCLGMIDGVLEDAVAYAQQREAFGGPIARFQVLQHKIADIAIAQAQSELLAFKAATMQARGLPVGQVANLAKLVASEHAGEAADLGIQILGGAGYTAETDMQRYWRDARLFRLAPISSEMIRNGLAESLGLPRSY